MAGLARVICNPRPGEQAQDLRHPAELREFADRTAVESLLFDAFIPAAYRHDPSGRWKAQLMFLARHLEFRIVGNLLTQVLTLSSHERMKSGVEGPVLGPSDGG